MTSQFTSYTSIRIAYNKLMKSIKLKSSSELVSIWDSYGRVLYDDVVSNVDVPEKNSSHMDGFAVFSIDIKNARASNPVILKVTNEIQLGKISDISLQPGQAIRIPTGGYLPLYADTVVPSEYANFDHEFKKVKISTPFPRGSFVSTTGKYIKKNTVLFQKGFTLKSQDLSLVSTIGINKLKVYKKPRIAIIPTGSELTDNMKEVIRGKILNTNGRVISKLIEEIGGVPVNMGITSDSISKIQEKINLALSSYDIILTIGGSSVGKHDLVVNSINQLGSPGVIVHGVKLDRGRVTGMAALKNKPIIILPGPIQGALNAFVVFTLPLIRSLLGLSQFSKKIQAELTEGWQTRKRFQNFAKIMYVRLSLSKSGNLRAIPITGETADLTVLTRSNGYVIVAEKKPSIERGEYVKAHFLPGFSFSSGDLFDFF